MEKGERLRPPLQPSLSPASATASSSSASSLSIRKPPCPSSSPSGVPLSSLRRLSLAACLALSRFRTASAELNIPPVGAPHAKHFGVLANRLIAQAPSKKWPQRVTTGSGPNGWRQMRQAKGISSSSSDEPGASPASRAAASDEACRLSSCQPDR